MTWEDTVKVYGIHRRGESDVASALETMVMQLQELEHEVPDDKSGEADRLFQEASSAIEKLKRILA